VPYYSSDTRHWDQSFVTSTFSNLLQINFLATGTLAANDFHSALPTPVHLLIYSSCFSWSRWCMCFYPIDVSYLLHCCLYLSLELSSKGGCAQCQGAWILRSWWFHSLHMSFAQTCHMSYTIDYLSEGGVSESFCDSDVWCRPWLVSVTLGVDYSLVNWEIFEGLPLRYFPRLYHKQR